MQGTVNLSVLNKLRFVAAFTATICVLFGVIYSAEAGDIGGISPQVFKCMKNNRSGSGGSITYHGGQHGKITIDFWGGSVNFYYNQNSHTLSISNPQGIGGDRIEGGLRDTAKWCRG